MKSTKLLPIGILILLILATTSALAEDTPETPASTEESPKKFELNVAGSYSVSPNERGSRKPGLGLFLGYKLSPWSTLGLKFDSRAHGSGGFHDDYTELTLSYKYWLALGKKWSPYVQAGAGYARVSNTTIGARPGGAREEVGFPLRGELALQAGGGYRYALTKDAGLDFGMHLHSLGAPWSLREKFIVSKIGLDVAF
jgi:opacity protein-like surface antigen